MSDTIKLTDLPAAARAALVALATHRDSDVAKVSLLRFTDERKQPVWLAKGECYKNQDITPLIDAGILRFVERRGDLALEFTERGVDAWYAYSGTHRPPPADQGSWGLSQ